MAFGFGFGFTKLWAALSPALSLDFLGREALDSRITFTRADTTSCATRFNSSGLLEVMALNLLPYSQDFGNAAWNVQNCSKASTSETAPDGTPTAVRVLDAPAVNAYIFNQYDTVAHANQTYTFSVWLKAGTKPGQISLQIKDGTLVATAVSTPMSITTAWARYSVTGTFGAAPAPNVRVLADPTDNTNAGDYFMWGAQLEIGSVLGGYIKTGAVATSGPRFDYDPAVPADLVGPELKGTGNLVIFGVPPTGSGYDKRTGIGAIRRTDVSNRTDVAFNGLTAGKTYAVNLSCNVGNFGDLSLRINGGSTSVFLVGPGVSGTYYITAGADGNITFVVNGNGGVIGFTLASMKEVSFAPKGLLIEESRTNLLTWSRDLTNAAWVKIGISAVALTAVGIDGAVGASSVTEDAGGGASMSNSVAITANTTHTYSVILKYVNNAWFRLRFFDNLGADGYNAWFNIQTGVKGTLTAVGAASGGVSNIVNLGNGFYRCSITAIVNATAVSSLCQIMSAAADNNTTRVPNASYIADIAQTEVGAFATSPIPTTAGAVTRAADVNFFSGTPFTNVYNPLEGTLIAEGIFSTSSTSTALAYVHDGSAVNRIFLRKAGAPSNISDSAAVAASVFQSVNNPVNTITPGTVARMGIAYSAAGGMVAVNGVLGTSGGAITMPTGINQMQIGMALGSVHLNGHIRRIQYYPIKLPDATLRTQTA